MAYIVSQTQSIPPHADALAVIDDTIFYLHGNIVKRCQSARHEPKTCPYTLVYYMVNYNTELLCIHVKADDECKTTDIILLDVNFNVVASHRYTGTEGWRHVIPGQGCAYFLTSEEYLTKITRVNDDIELSQTTIQAYMDDYTSPFQVFSDGSIRYELGDMHRYIDPIFIHLEGDTENGLTIARTATDSIFTRSGKTLLNLRNTEVDVYKSYLIGKDVLLSVLTITSVPDSTIIIINRQAILLKRSGWSMQTHTLHDKPVRDAIKSLMLIHHADLSMVSRLPLDMVKEINKYIAA